ncbi:GTP-binding protein RAD-like [Babylonia areolata]|uniref:GTP-binding protein RAD-like n=1 Tax=Babylonia areolata TaxID=304850 RepID=UPI003FD2265D
MAPMMTDILVEGEKITHDDERFLRASPIRDSASAPHSRSSSFKNRPRPKLSLDIQAAQRPRTNSLPTPQIFLTLPDPDWMSSANSRGSKDEGDAGGGGLCRVRSFKTTSKGLVNRGDSFKRSTHSLASNHSRGSNDKGLAVSEEPKPLSKNATPTPTHYKVLMMGSTGSGKSALTRQFMTSEYKGTYENSSPDVEPDKTTVPVLLDGEESTLEFYDEEQHPDVDKEGIAIDAFVVVFSVTDSESYNEAVKTVRRLRVESGTSRTVILVANKIDLARLRRVTKRDATKLATKYDCRYTETSAALNHHVDELLVGILSQIRQEIHSPNPALLDPGKRDGARARSKSPARAALSFFQKLFGHGSASKSKKKSTDEILFVK